MAALIDLVHSTHASEKVLIFTEYKDTANYIGAALSLSLDLLGVFRSGCLVEVLGFADWWVGGDLLVA
jgi:hypothetical protein